MITTLEEIKAANIIIDDASRSNANAVDTADKKGIPPHIWTIVVAFLKSEGIIEECGPGGGWGKIFTLTHKGHTLHKNGISIDKYLVEKKQSEKEASERHELDLQHKKLQIDDLVTKLNTINPEQLNFWRRQRWQFWLTLMLAGAAFILSVINFMKDLYIK